MDDGYTKIRCQIISLDPWWSVGHSLHNYYYGREPDVTSQNVPRANLDTAYGLQFTRCGLTRRLCPVKDGR